MRKETMRESDMSHSWLQSIVKNRWKQLQDEASLSQSQVDYHMRRIQELKHHTVPSSVLDYLIHLLSILIDTEATHSLKSSDRDRLLKESEKILKVFSVKNRDQQGQFLIGAYHLACMNVTRDAGQFFQARWHGQVAIKQLQHDATIAIAPIQLELAKLNARLGNSAEAEHLMVSHLESLIKGGQDADNEMLIEIATQFRVSGKVEVAEKILNRIAAKNESQSVKLQWQNAALIAANSQNLKPLQAAGKRCLQEGAALESLRTQLWTLAVQSRRWVEKMPSVNQFVRMHFSHVKHDVLQKKLFECVKTIMSFYDTEVALFQRRMDLLKVLDECQSLPTVEDELLVLAAAYRALTRMSQHELGSQALYRYQALSRRVTGHLSQDVFCMFSTQEDENDLESFRPEVEVLNLLAQ